LFDEYDLYQPVSIHRFTYVHGTFYSYGSIDVYADMNYFIEIYLLFLYNVNMVNRNLIDLDIFYCKIFILVKSYIQYGTQKF